MKSPETIAELGELVRLGGGVGGHDRYRLDFLPAAIEILERPVSVLSRAISLTIMALFCTATAWACLAKIDIVATADGKIVPAGQVKTIQPLDTGIVARILVADGQHVRAGDILIELDPTVSVAEQQRTARDLLQARLDVARLEALLAPDGQQPYRIPDGVDPATTLSEARMLGAERQEQQSRLASFDRELDQKTAEREGAQTDVAKLEATIPLLAQRTNAKKTLLAKQYASLFSYLELEQQLVEAQHDLLSRRHHVEELGSAIASIRQQRQEAEAGFARDALDRLLKARQQVDQLTQDAIKARQKTEQRNLTAPVDGTVQQLAMHTVGGVVTPAQPLMVIVPDSLDLVAEARISNRDIGFVHAGQEAEIKVATFDFTHYGTLHGRVVDVSRDAIPPEDKTEPHETSYLAHVTLERTDMTVDGRRTELGAGMRITAEIKTGRRRVVDYLLSPMRRATGASLHER